MKRILLFAVIFLLFAYPAQAAFKIYLKNGSVISGVKYYKKTDSAIEFIYYGGQVSFPVREIEKIEAYEGGEVRIQPLTDTPVTTSTAPSGEQQTREVNPRIQQRYDHVNTRISSIEQKEAQLKSLESEHNAVMIRLQNLATKSELSPQEQQWRQMNSIKKRQLEEQIEALKQELTVLLGEKERLIREKAELETEMR